MDQEFLKRLLATFKLEAEEHLKTISTGLIKYEKCEDMIERVRIIEPVYRAAHSLKGAARAVNLIEIERLCQNMESVYAALKKQELRDSYQLFDNLHSGVDLINSYLSSNNEEQKSEINNEIEDLINLLNEHLVVDYQEPPPQANFTIKAKLENNELKEVDKQPISKASESPVKENIKEQQDTSTGKDKKKEPKPVKPSTTSQHESIQSSDTVRISTSKLDSLLLQGEEMLSAKLSSDELSRNISTLENYFEIWKREIEKVNVHIRNMKSVPALSVLPNESNELANKAVDNFVEWNQAFLKQLDDEIRELSKQSQSNSYSLGRMINRLITDMKEILLLPFSHLLDLFPKLVRDLSRDVGKNVDLHIEGSEIMIDRRILEEIKDPLVHLVRNSIDHGIESKDKRKELDKNEKAVIKISVKPAEGNKILIEIKDDGKGIDTERIKQSAIKQGLKTEDEIAQMSKHEITALIFQSGVSTNKTITDISGRGLGMAIVKEKVEKLGGSIRIDSVKEMGTKFQIYLPLTLTTFRGIILESAERLFVIQTVHVKNVLRVKVKDIKTVENKATIMIDNMPVSLVYLSDILELPQAETEPDCITVIIFNSVDKNIAFAVDELVNEQEILLKQFNYQLVKLKHFSGATILGSGKVVPILNIDDLLKSAEEPSKQRIKKVESKKTGHKVLIVDDSITSRTLLKDIFESAGYSTKLAVDGLDAVTTLRSEQFDIVISDVEMPRMNGFELTEKIKNDEKLSELPVVLVTALAKKEDREKGMDVGANAYIVKSSFDQSNLLNIVKRLL